MCVCGGGGGGANIQTKNRTKMGMVFSLLRCSFSHFSNGVRGVRALGLRPTLQINRRSDRAL